MWIKANAEVWEILKIIKGVSHQFQSTISPYEAIDEAKRQYYTYIHNNDHMDVNTYVQTMKNIWDTIVYYGGTIGEDEALINYDKELDLNSGKTPKTEE